jgi:hypothetical protein
MIVSEEPPRNILDILDRTTARVKPLVGESILYDIFIKYGSPTNEKMDKLEKMYESRLRILANEKRGKSILSYKDLLIECACDLFTEMVLAFNILLTGIIDPNEHLKFFFGQASYVDRHLLDIPSLIEKRLRAFTRFGINEHRLARAFIKLIQKAHSADIPIRPRL